MQDGTVECIQHHELLQYSDSRVTILSNEGRLLYNDEGINTVRIAQLTFG